MKKKINGFIGKAISYKSLVINFGYLSGFQILNLLIPLITYPYLIRVLGKETYGLVVLVQTIISYLAILVNFGFNLSATKEISIHRNNHEKLNEIVSSVFVIKGTLLVISFLFLFLVINFIPLAKTHKILLFLSMYACVYDMIFPLWYFQGIEKMKYITLTNALSRITFLILIFILIKSENDYLLVPVIYGIGALIAGFISLYIIFIKDKIKFSFQKLSILKHHTKESFTFFISSISIQIYINANKVIVGSFLGLAEVAVYDLAEKLVSLMKLPLSLISQTIFPKISNDLNKVFVWKMFRYVFLLNIFIFSVVYITAPFMVVLIGGNKLTDAIGVLRMLAITVPVIGMSNFLGIQLLIPFGFKKTFTKVIVFSSLVFVFIFFIFYLSNTLNIFTISLMTILTEFYVTIHMFIICKQKKLLWTNMTI